MKVQGIDIVWFCGGREMVRVTLISDTHGLHDSVEIEPTDILIHCGDFSNIGEMSVLKSFNHWLLEQPSKINIVVAGNHDRMFEKNPIASRKLLTNAIYLENSGVEVMGLKIWGSPVTSTLPSWSFVETDETKRFDHWKQIPMDLDILVTHGPPHGIMDQVPRFYHEEGPVDENCGDVMLLAHVTRTKPKYHVFGHIHEGYGRIETPHTTFINCSQCDAMYNIKNPPQIINL